MSQFPLMKISNLTPKIWSRPKNPENPGNAVFPNLSMMLAAGLQKMY